MFIASNVLSIYRSILHVQCYQYSDKTCIWPKIVDREPMLLMDTIVEHIMINYLAFMHEESNYPMKASVRILEPQSRLSDVKLSHESSADNTH